MLDDLQQDADFSELDISHPLSAYDRWEQQQWSARDFDVRRDEEGWQKLRPYLARELTEGIRQFFLGETAVTETLAPIAYGAPTTAARLFLCTQLADEAKHTVFFTRYLSAISNYAQPPRTSVAAASVPASWEHAPRAFQDLLDGELRAVTIRVLDSPARASAWYEAVAIYHLVAEGVVAVTGMRSVLAVVRHQGAFPSLTNALLHIARDESRHIAFGVWALRDGVGRGHQDAITARILDCLPHAVGWLVSPERRHPGLLAGNAADSMAASMERRWGLALGALRGRLERSGLGAAVTDVERLWAATIDDALSEYHTRHGVVHPYRSWQARR